MGILNRHDGEQEAKEFLNQIEKNKAIVEQWGDIHYFDPEEVREIALKFAQEDCDRHNSLCLCHKPKGPQPSGEIHGITEFELSDLSKPMSEYYGSFRSELEDVLINRFGIKRIMH